jgi:hypothetical protein
MDPATLNLTREILGYGMFCFVSLPAAKVDSGLIRALNASAAGLENMHAMDGNASEEARLRGRYQYLRAEPSGCVERDLVDKGMSEANVLIRLEAKSRGPLDAYEQAMRAQIVARNGSVHTRVGISKPRSYTSYAMTQFAYANAVAPANGIRHPLGVVTPQNKTRAWWEMDWMRRESFFLPRYDDHGRMVAEGHALASAAGVPSINRRLVHHPEGYGLAEGYDFIGYFEFSEADRDVFRNVMAALRDRNRNPEWDYVREGPEWWGRRVERLEELWAA